MKNSAHLPDAMPDIEKPTLIVICDSHHCRFIELGKHTLMGDGEIVSKEETFTDHEGRFQSPAAVGKGGMISGGGDLNQAEDNRLHEFSNQAAKRIHDIVMQKGIAQLYLSAPNKFLPLLKKHLHTDVSKILKAALDGNYVKETPKQLLTRFMPELEREVQKLKDMEGYGGGKNLPK